MRFSEAWLREWVSPAIDTQTLSEQLTMAGLEVDSVEPAAAVFSGVVVGKVLSKEKHPEADKLSVCQVDVNGEAILQIVCGAKNVAAEMKVPVATVGAKLPGDFKIKKAKLRGVQSLGMICSASELGLAESSDGILPLPADAPLGEDFRDYLGLEDQCIDVDLTPDRGDCLSIRGVAREVAVINRLDLTPPSETVCEATIEDAYAVSLLAPEACPRYLCRIVRGIDGTAETPQWMVEKLRRGGIRALHPVVDVTNYVLLELGQPMHGFDLTKLQGEIRVRHAHAGEKLTLLNGEEVSLSEDSLVIADERQALALAGIMGGEDSGVSESSRDILLESAFFAPLAIVGKARSYGLHTDSSHRFERGVDPELQRQAMERATELLLSICGGQAGPIVEAISQDHLAEAQAIPLRASRVARVLGVPLAGAEIEEILRRLGMQVDGADGEWRVTPPSWRFDVRIEADLVEEIGRIYGYDRIPSTCKDSPVDMHPGQEIAFDLYRAKRLLAARDYQEVITYSFISPEWAAATDPDQPAIALANPISADMSVMRPSLWAGLLQTAKYNQARQQDRIRIFESGQRFRGASVKALEQQVTLAGLICGESLEAQWGEASRKVDFYDLKCDLQAILALTGNAEAYQFVADEHPALHPGQSARILREGVSIGWIGLLHPKLQKSLGMNGNSYLFEVELEGLEAGRLPRFEPLSKFPSIKRDLALVLDQNISYSQVLACIRQAGTEFLKDIRLFDVYTGDNIEAGRRSLALSLILQDSSQTLTDETVDAEIAAILAALQQQLQAQLRD